MEWNKRSHNTILTLFSWLFFSFFRKKSSSSSSSSWNECSGVRIRIHIHTCLFFSSSVSKNSDSLFTLPVDCRFNDQSIFSDPIYKECQRTWDWLPSSSLTSFKFQSKSMWTKNSSWSQVPGVSTSFEQKFSNWWLNHCESQYKILYNSDKIGLKEIENL